MHFIPPFVEDELYQNLGSKNKEKSCAFFDNPYNGEEKFCQHLSKMEKKNIKIAIIDNSLDPSLYDPTTHWSTYLDVTWESFRAPEGLFPNLNNGFSHLILTGSEASILERENWVHDEAEVVEEALEKDLSILGSCWGHQLLAFILCGPAHVRRSPRPEVGWIPIQIEQDSPFLGPRRRIFSFSIHFDEVVSLESDFDILASSKYCPVQAFQWKKRAVWGIQIHPEINIEEGKILLKNLTSLRSKTSPYFEEALKQRPKDSGLIHLLVRNFITSKGRLFVRNE